MIAASVTAEDIQRGEPCSPCACPVALAIARACRLPLSKVSVDGWMIEVDGITYYTPLEVDKFINQFDALEQTEPFEFELDTIV